MYQPANLHAVRAWYGRRRLSAWLRRNPGARAVTTFRDCSFFAGLDNKIEIALLRGDNAYDQANFTALAHFVKPGYVCFDVGANIGVYSMIFARLSAGAGQVHAFEPVQHIARRFLANARLNGFDAIRLNDCALGSAESTLEMYQVKEGQVRGGTSTFVRNENIAAMGADAFTARSVRVTTLDQYAAGAALARVDFIKIDVEGFELQVLEGAAATLRRFHPTLLFEYEEARHGGEEARGRFRALLDGHGYRTYEFTAFRDELALTPFEFTHQPLQRNLLCVYGT